jgi:branched-chain amino acid transport system ATP-binding protein
MLSKPRLLMLDEPSLGLAPTIVDKVYDQLRQIRAQGVALLVVEQNAARAFALADRACVMSRGAFTLTGTPEEVGRHEAFDAAYFGVAMTAGAA